MDLYHRVKYNNILVSIEEINIKDPSEDRIYNIEILIGKRTSNKDKI